MIRALALRLIRIYPLAWRKRYEAEVCALIDDSRLHPRDLAELLRGLVTERARELMLSTEHVGRTMFLLSAMRFVLAVGIVALAFVTGQAVRTDPVSDAVQISVGVGALCFLTALVWSMIRVRKIRRATPAFRYPAWVGAAFIGGLFVTISAMTAVGLTQPSEPHDLSTFGRYIPWITYSMYAGWAMDHLSFFWPEQPLLAAFGELSWAKAEIKSGEQWVAGCHEMMALGVPSPLDDALAQVARGAARRDEAQRKLDALGYRARFERNRHHGNPA